MAISAAKASCARESLYLIGAYLSYVRDVDWKVPSGIFLPGDSWEEAEAALQATQAEHGWVLSDEFSRGIVFREAIPHYQSSFLRNFNAVATRGTPLAFALHPTHNLLNYSPGDKSLAGWTGELHCLMAEIEALPGRADGLKRGYATAMVRENTSRKAKSACRKWLSQNQWKVVKYVESTTAKMDYANLVLGEQTPFQNEAERVGIHVQVFASGNEDD